MAVIKCDACGGMNDPKGFRKEQRKEGDLEISFFTCGICGKEYIGFISDTQMRELVKKIHREILALRLMRMKKLDQKSIRKMEQKLESLRREALELEKELKNRYEEEQKHEQTATAGASEGNFHPVSGGTGAEADGGESAETVP